MSRMRSLQRILKVQNDLRRLTEAKLAVLVQRHQSLEVMESQILSSMTQGDPRDQALASMASDRLRWLDRDLKENLAAKSLCEDQLRNIAVQKLTCERVVRRLHQDEIVMNERRFGLELLDTFYASLTSFK